MMRQYRAIKAEHGDCILFFRLGDFYEMFDEDARTASRELDLMLTTRDRSKAKEEQVPMCGVPYHSSEAYIARLIQKGYKVAICEQMEDPALAKGLVDRDIVRVITPGTVVDSSMLDETSSNYLCAICEEPQGAGVCFADVSTGEVVARAFLPGERLRILNELGRFTPVEAVLSQDAAADDDIMASLNTRMKCMSRARQDLFDYAACAQRVLRQFGKSDLSELELLDAPQTVQAIGALLTYIAETQKTDISYINKLELYSDGKYMELDFETSRSLELTSAMRTREKRGSLLWVMDRTRTPMGARLMRSFVSRPLLSPAAIGRRLSAVEELYSDSVKRGEIMEELRHVGDMERLIGRTVYGTANPRDMLALANSAAALPDVLCALRDSVSPLLQDIYATDPIADVANTILDAISDEPPISVHDGYILREGFDPEVDRLRGLLKGSKQAMIDIEARERARTGKKLRVSYNKVFGYYIEIPRSQSEDVPEDYIRKQTLVNTERFVTQELSDLENELLTASDRLTELEYRRYNELREWVSGQLLRVQAASSAVALLDVLCSLAQCAVDYAWVKPEIALDGVIDIKDGRHPVVERTQTDTLFVPNDTYLDLAGSTCAIITGPNMAGKSTYMRQTALIVLMAQMGSFVPARSARVGIVDRVFTRIGASDDLAAGRSTFMVEMSEVAAILKNATSRSLLILDEIGRGTSTYDGMAIARAVLEYCADKRKLGAKTMFATHYHELTALEGQVPGVKNYNITAKKRGGDLIFLRKIVPGGADDSYGVEVAKLAGVPESVIRRANAVLAELTRAGAPAPAAGRAPEGEGQVSLESMAGDEVSRRLRDLDINTLTPLEALNLLYELKKKVSN